MSQLEVPAGTQSPSESTIPGPKPGRQSSLNQSHRAASATGQKSRRKAKEDDSLEALAAKMIGLDVDPNWVNMILDAIDTSEPFETQKYQFHYWSTSRSCGSLIFQ